MFKGSNRVLRLFLVVHILTYIIILNLVFGDQFIKASIHFNEVEKQTITKYHISDS